MKPVFLSGEVELGRKSNESGLRRPSEDASLLSPANTLLKTAVFDGRGRQVAGFTPWPPIVCATRLKNSECPFDPFARAPALPLTGRVVATNAPWPVSGTLKIVVA